MKLEGITEIFGVLERGQLAVDFTTELTNVLAAMTALDTCKGGVTLSLNFSMKNGVVATEAEIKSKMPKAKRRTSTLWVDSDGSLHTSDPNQINMFPTRERQRQVIDN